MKKVTWQSGTLYVVATPIGNLDDITQRAIRVLGSVDAVLAEDTRRTRVLLSHLNIQKPIFSYFEGNRASREGGILFRLEGGQSLALVSDAGTPGISDPGAEMVAACHKKGIRVVPIPGPSALALALSVSGLKDELIHFAGFLPASGTERKVRLREMAALRGALVLYEAPHRLIDTFQDLVAALGNRKTLVVREATKVHEEIAFRHLEEWLQWAKENPARGEFTMVVYPREGLPPEIAGLEEITFQADEVAKQDLSPAKAAAELARRTGLSRSDAYKTLLDRRPPGGR